MKQMESTKVFSFLGWDPPSPFLQVTQCLTETAEIKTMTWLVPEPGEGHVSANPHRTY